MEKFSYYYLLGWSGLVQIAWQNVLKFSPVIGVILYDLNVSHVGIWEIWTCYLYFIPTRT